MNLAAIQKDITRIRLTALAFLGKIIIPLLCLLLSGCKDSSQTISINMCQDGTVSPLVLLAQEKAYFADEGLEINFFPMGDGRLAMDGLREGKCTVAVVSESAVVGNNPGTPPFSILASAGATDNASRVVTDRRKGITKAADLKGKRIGVRKGEISHLFVEMFLRKNGLKPEQVSIKLLEPQYLSEALLKGQIEAFASTDIYLTEATRRLGDNAVVLAEPGLCFNHSFLVIKKQELSERPQIADRLLRALSKAESRAARAPEELVSIVSRRREIPQQDAKELVSRHRLRLTLQQQIFPGLADYHQFLQEQGITSGNKAAAYYSFIDSAPLKKFNPAAVNIN